MPIAPKPQPPEAQPQPRTVARVRRAMPNVLVAPSRVPAHIDMTPEAPTLPDAGIPVLAGVTSSGFGALGSTFTAPPPPRPAVAPPAPPPPAAPVQVSMGVQSAKLIFGPKPAYPALARAARVQGVVRMQAVIARDGSIRNLQGISIRPAAAAREDGCRRRGAMAISTNAAELRAGGSDHRNRCELHAWSIRR